MKKLKNRLLPIFSICAVLACLVVCVFSSTVFASTADAVSIVKTGLSCDSTVRTEYQVSSNDSVKLSDIRLLVSDSTITVSKGTKLSALGKEVAVKEHEATVIVSGESQAVFYSNPILPKEMRKSIYAVPVAVDGQGKITEVGTQNVSSPYVCVINSFDNSPSEMQKWLYSSLLDYGAALQGVLCTDEEIAQNGGWIDEYYHFTMTYKLDGNTVDVKDAEYRRPDDVLKVDGIYSASGSFAGFAKAGGVIVRDADKSKASLSLTCVSINDPAVANIDVNYNSNSNKLYTYENFDGKWYRDVNNAPFENEGSDSSGYASVNDGSLVIGAEIDAGNEGIVLSADNTAGSLFVADTDFVFNTNYAYGGSSRRAIAYIALRGGMMPTASKELCRISLLTTDGKTFSVGDHSFTLNESHNLRIEYMSEDIYGIYIDGVLVDYGTSANAYFVSGISVVMSGITDISHDSATPQEIVASIALDNTFMGVVEPNPDALYRQDTITFDDLSSVSSVSGSATTNTIKPDKAYDPNGVGYAQLISGGPNGAGKYVEIGRGSAANEVGFALKTDITEIPEFWYVEFDFMVEEVVVRSSKSTSTWPIRIRFGGNSDSTSFANLILNYNRGTNKLSSGDASFSAGEWVKLTMEYNRATNEVKMFINNKECSNASYASYTGNAEKFPYIFFSTRGYSDSAADDLTTDTVESTSVQRYSSIRMAIDNVTIGGLFSANP